MDLDSIGQEFAASAKDFAKGAAQLGHEVSASVSDATGEMSRYRRFADLGHDLFSTRLITSHGGNLSECAGGRLFITRTNCMLGHLETGDIVSTTWEPSPDDEGASRELIVHRTIYHAIAASQSIKPEDLNAAVMHTHALHVIARTLADKRIEPADSEGRYFLGDVVSVISPDETIGSAQAAEEIASYVFEGARVVVIKGHGPFVVAPTMAEAMRLTTCLEASCEILSLMGR